MLGCAFIFFYMNLFCEKDIISKEHMLQINLQKKVVKPISSHCSTSVPYKNIREPLAFWCFGGYRNWTVNEMR